MKLKHLLQFIRLIESVPIEYMITGSIASILYGRPRLTQDMDVVVILPTGKLLTFVSLFRIEEYYCPPLEIVQEEAMRKNRGHFNIIDQFTGFKIDVYPAGTGELEQWGLAHRKKIELITNEEVFVAPPEYVIVNKLLYYKEGRSEKHIEDIRGMLGVCGETIDRSKILEWATKIGVTKEWNQV